MQPGKDLLAVRVADGDRPHAGADGPQGRLVEINEQGIVRPSPGGGAPM